MPAFQIVDLTPVSPTGGNSEFHIAYRDFGPPAECGTCDAIEECPTCAGDTPFKYPVLAGDNVYFQFRSIDKYNVDPDSPEFGWKNGEDEYYVDAAVEFGNSETPVLELAESDAVISRNVGWDGASYQNLILNSAKILDYIREEADMQMDCFRVQIRTYERVPSVETTTVLSLNAGFPTRKNVGDKIVQFNNIQTWNGTAWVESGPPTMGQQILVGKTGLYYQWDGDSWEIVTPTFVPQLLSTCSGTWYKFVLCDQSVLLEGVHGLSDCAGHYYGISEEDVDAGLLPYRDRYRLPMSFEMSGLVRTDVVTDENGNTTEFKRNELWKLNAMTGLPLSVVLKLANTLDAAHIYIDSNEFQNPGNITKNVEIGEYWWSQITIERTRCEKTNSCDDVAVFNPLIQCEEQNPVSGSNVNVDGSQGNYHEVVVCGNSLELPPALVRDGEGNIIASLDPEDEYVCEAAECPDATVENSNASYTQTVASGGTLVLPDTTVNIYVDAVLVDSDTFATLEDETINIIWT